MNKKELELIVELGEKLLDYFKSELKEIWDREDREVKKETQREMVNYVCKGEFHHLKDVNDKISIGKRLGYRGVVPTPATVDDIPLEDILDYPSDTDFEMVPMTLDILDTLKEKFYKDYLEIGPIDNDRIQITVGFAEDKEKKTGYLSLLESVNSFIRGIDDMTLQQKISCEPKIEHNESRNNDSAQ